MAAYYIIAALGLAVLMIVHEGGHYLAAKRFGMRVVKFSIGFGPTLWRHKPEKSPTVYQVAIIPFLAYVQIAGMNPYEDNDPKDPGSYANASLWARTVTIAAGPLTNYLFASVLIFFGLLIGGQREPDEASMRVEVGDGGAASTADIRDGDKILAINDQTVKTWDDLKKAVSSHPGESIDIEIERDGAVLHKAVVPAGGGQNRGKILIGPFRKIVKVTVPQAAKLAVTGPPGVVYATVVGIARWISGKEKAEVSGPVGIVKETARVARIGPGELLQFLGALSAYLGAFNLLPFPALDGGRLLFLGIEATSRRRPDAKIEARVHAVGLLMLLALIAVVTVTELAPKSSESSAPPQPSGSATHP
jgi:regulator of sigma E protease